jgi:hypothetical protein
MLRKHPGLIGLFVRGEAILALLLGVEGIVGSRTRQIAFGVPDPRIAGRMPATRKGGTPSPRKKRSTQVLGISKLMRR